MKVLCIYCLMVTYWLLVRQALSCIFTQAVKLVMVVNLGKFSCYFGMVSVKHITVSTGYGPKYRCASVRYSCTVESR